MNRDENPGHTALIADLKKLVHDAQNYMFDDSRGEAATPKVDLLNRLNDLATKVKDGRYDQ